MFKPCFFGIGVVPCVHAGVRTEECGPRKMGGAAQILKTPRARAPAHPPVTLRGSLPDYSFRSFRSPAPKVGLHGNRTGVPSRVAAKETWGTSPCRRAGEKNRPGSGRFSLPPTYHPPPPGLISPFPPGFSGVRLCVAPYGSPNRALDRKLTDFQGFYIENI